ncbi:MAG: hypothetical protein ACAI44_16625, partial [Candidatus Sericytochromatia bacterium]
MRSFVYRILTLSLSLSLWACTPPAADLNPPVPPAIPESAHQGLVPNSRGGALVGSNLVPNSTGGTLIGSNLVPNSTGGTLFGSGLVPNSTGGTLFGSNLVPNSTGGTLFGSGLVPNSTGGTLGRISVGGDVKLAAPPAAFTALQAAAEPASPLLFAQLAQQGQPYTIDVLVHEQPDKPLQPVLSFRSDSTGHYELRNLPVQTLTLLHIGHPDFPRQEALAFVEASGEQAGQVLVQHIDLLSTAAALLFLDLRSALPQALQQWSAFKLKLTQFDELVFKVQERIRVLNYALKTELLKDAEYLRLREQLLALMTANASTTVPDGPPPAADAAPSGNQPAQAALNFEMPLTGYTFSTGSRIPIRLRMENLPAGSYVALFAKAQPLRDANGKPLRWPAENGLFSAIWDSSGFGFGSLSLQVEIQSETGQLLSSHAGPTFNLSRSGGSGPALPIPKIQSVEGVNWPVLPGLEYNWPLDFSLEDSQGSNPADTKGVIGYGPGINSAAAALNQGDLIMNNLALAPGRTLIQWFRHDNQVTQSSKVSGIPPFTIAEKLIPDSYLLAGFADPALYAPSPNNSWHQWVTVFDKAETRHYLDGVLHLQSSPVELKNLQLGSELILPRMGQIDEVQLYKGMLTPNQILALYGRRALAIRGSGIEPDAKILLNDVALTVLDRVKDPEDSSVTLSVALPAS